MTMRRTRFAIDLRRATTLAALSLSACLDFGNTGDAGLGGNGSSDSTLSNPCITTFNPCGGDITGTWGVKSICSVGNPADTVNASLATSYPGCNGAFTKASLTVVGQKKYESGVLTSSEKFQLSQTLQLNETCFNELRGTSMTDNTCATVANAFTVASVANESSVASCGLTTLACSCQIESVFENTANSYALAGNSLTEVGAIASIGSSVDYCVTGNLMTQQRTLPPGTNYVISYVRR